jgi:dinuclear metal center YbgI/SA1388 family protein
MIHVQDICDLIESFAPLNLQESYDNAGLLVGKPEWVLNGVLIALDVTEPVINEAIEHGCNLIISHHPLIFKGIKQLTGVGRVNTCLIKAVKHDMAIYAGHTNVDAVLNGVNGMIADKLGLVNTRILVPVQTDTAGNPAGPGLIGDLVDPMDELSLMEQIKARFCCASLQYSKLTGRPVKTVAVCGGSGSEYLEAARRAGATVFFTGEAKHHEFFTDGLEILLVVAGHFETEQFTKQLFFDLITKKFPTFAVRVSTEEKNPVNYL